MSDANNTKHENVVVLAIYMMNINEAILEMNCLIEMDQYRTFIAKCVQVIQEETGLLDVVVQNSSIYGVYSNLTDIHTLQKVATKIYDLNENRAETLVYGVGIAKGRAEKINIEVSDQNWKLAMWLGNVLKRADAMAQQAICDGTHRVFSAEHEI